MFNYDRFEGLRRSKGITKKFIAITLDRSPTLCQDWKLKKSQPSAQQLAIVADILGTTPAYLLGESDDILPPDLDEMETLLSTLRDREDIRMLFKLAKNATPDDVRRAMKIIEALRQDD